MVSRKYNEHIGGHIVANLSEEERSTKSAGICCLSSTLTRSPTITYYLLFTMKGNNWKYLRTLHHGKLAISDHTNLDIRLRFKFHRNFYIVVDDSRHLETVKRTGCLFIAESLRCLKMSSYPCQIRG